ncbi:hypothetical protein [Fibrobacter sp. UWP2]|uniref:hypothetical protein n=1 Tax=Fibrobacter sp. UWP2 TaxID=1896216 RepID=UPI000914D887|nr:hypothetical protein [Fibrobacter sp. UWP2]SHJ34558.1 hypothetical protein SAMN05720471_13012 [Fibrobacter sp. UWP2]
MSWTQNQPVGNSDKFKLRDLEKQVDFFVKTNLPPSEGLLPAHAQWSGYEFAVQLVRSAKKELVIVDDVVYHVGASFKDLGNQMTAFSVLNFVTKEQVLAMVK